MAIGLSGDFLGPFFSMMDAGMPIKEMNCLDTIHVKLELAFLWPQGIYGSGRNRVGERKREGV